MQRGKQREIVSNQVTEIEGGAARSRDTPDGRAGTSLARASPPADTTAEKASRSRSGCEPGCEPNGEYRTLRDEVMEALRGVLHDQAASAAAKASAGRTLMEFFEGGSIDSGKGRHATELTPGELDEEIARLTRGR